MSRDRSNDDYAIAFALFVVWFLAFFICSINDKWSWWYSFPIVVAYSIIGALSSPLSKVLISYIVAGDWEEAEVPHSVTVSFWPLVLPISLMAAFFVLMGRVTR